MEPARPTWSSTPQSPAEGFAASLPLLPFSRRHAVSDGGDEAGLTSKPHRDRLRPGEAAPRRSSLTWTVSPATGIGLPPGRPGRARRLDDATTDPDGLHDTDASRSDRSARNAGPDDSPLPAPGPVAADAGSRRPPRPPPPRSPDGLQRPLRLPGRRSGGQHIVADHDQGFRRAASRSAKGPARAGHEARQVGRPRRRVEPGLVVDPDARAGAGAGTARTSCPARRSRAAAPRVMVQVGSWPRARTVARRDGHRHQHHRPGRRRRRRRTRPPTAPASSRASGAAQRRAAGAPCGRPPAPRTTPSYAAAAHGGDQPRRASGSARPAARGAASSPRSAGHEQPARAGRSRRSAPPSSRSTAGVEQAVGRSQHPSDAQQRRAARSTPVAAGLWTGRLSRRSRATRRPASRAALPRSALDEVDQARRGSRRRGSRPASGEPASASTRPRSVVDRVSKPVGAPSTEGGRWTWKSRWLTGCSAARLVGERQAMSRIWLSGGRQGR